MHTVISAFATQAEADRAMDRLHQAGIARDDMHMQHRDLHVDGAMSRETWAGMEKEIAVDSHVLESIGHFFVSMFGKADEPGHADTYAQAVSRGECVVVVDTPDEVTAQRAAAILDEQGGRDRNIVPRSHGKTVREMVAERQATTH